MRFRNRNIDDIDRKNTSTGFYRVNYDAENWARIGKQLLDNHSVVSTINRAQVLDDALSLAQSGQLDYNLALNLTRYLANEEAYVPWASALSNLHFIEDMLSRTQFFGLFQVLFECFFS